ncbi:MAG: M20/M25/M40 family metallo-hydrolase, partial [Phycisphaerales bacterium]|nr:M20/M25/M40 family metallo-hydrolase [Phycisphaerales bacterium]
DQWADRPIPRRTVIGEPTSLQPVRAHKGHLSVTIAVGGRGGHSGFPESGVNAIDCALPVLEGLRTLRQELIDERGEWSALFPSAEYPVFTVANIAGGSAINVIPESCMINAGVRLLPGQNSTEFLPRLLAAISCSRQVETTELDQVGEGEILLAVINDTPSFGTAAEAPFLREVSALVNASEGLGANYGTDAGRIAKLGCTPVVFGPGDISVAHKPNEWMPLDEFARTPGLLEQLVR